LQDVLAGAGQAAVGARIDDVNVVLLGLDHGFDLSIGQEWTVNDRDPRFRREVIEEGLSLTGSTVAARVDDDERLRGRARCRGGASVPPTACSCCHDRDEQGYQPDDASSSFHLHPPYLTLTCLSMLRQ